MVAKASVSKTAAVGVYLSPPLAVVLLHRWPLCLRRWVNEIEESGGQAEHQLKELAAYLASWLQESKSKD